MKRKAALSITCLAALLFGSACSSSEQLVFVNYGGESMTAAKQGWIEPFSKETGVKFATDSPSDPAKVKAMVEAGATTWDIVDLDVGTGAKGCGTLFEKRSSEIDMSAIDPKYVTDDCGVPVMVQSMALVYNPEKFGDDPPTKITDFLDTQKYPGKRITLNYPLQGLEGLLLADGVNPESLYPLDLDRAAAVVKRLGKNLSLLPTVAGQAEGLESGDYAMCWCMMGRAAISEERGAKLGIVWHHAFSGWDALYAVKGSKFPEAQQKFLNFVATPKAQSDFTEVIPFGPTTPASKPKLTGRRSNFLAQYNEQAIGTPALMDPKWWKENSDKAFAAWTAMTSG
ncbi:extracellular solute-binding protein [Actinomadura sp. KC216]|uniref:extracellular solute-binding protein n=1 Tax=Actinomadura sp. KC216 TaxID=2530370 RepID=UPI001FB601A4|nr:extracellular solute-binding protein [Actinomadura sp. KC216]